MPSEADENIGYFSQLPFKMQKLVKMIGFPDYSSLEDEEAKIYELMTHGRCMTCEKPLGQHTSFIIARPGIVGAYCSGVCHADMSVLGFLQETHDDIQEKVKLRHLAMPQHDETPDTLGEDPAFEGDEGE